ncbi:MAG: YkgJ family cysteine cluster protein [Patescibacteria group bacterium]
MKIDTWKECRDCKVNCCKQKKIAYPLFLTKKEDKNFPDINDSFPCRFIGEKGLCGVHKNRPIDCRLFPFDTMEKGGIFYWIYWNTSCPITRKGPAREWEIRLQNIETIIIPNFKEWINAYSQFRFYEFIENFGMYLILRRINLK